MSIRVMSAVWSDAPYKETTLIVLLALADWSSDDGECWPKVAQIAKKARMSERGVQWCLKKLADDGAVSIIQESAGPGIPRRYQIGVQYLHPFKAKGVQVEAEKGCNQTHRNKEEPSLEPSNTSTLFPENEPENIIENGIFPYFLEQTGRSANLYTLTPARLKCGIARFREALKKARDDSPENAKGLMRVAIETLAASDWHMGRDPKTNGKKYSDWVDLFGTTEKFEKWLDRSE